MAACREFDLEVSEEENAVLVTLHSERLLCFRNEPRENDCSAGFLGFPWHFHDELMVMHSADTYATYSPSELLLALREGRVLMVELVKDVVCDVWLVGHESLDVSHLEAGESLTVRRLTL